MAILWCHKWLIWPSSPQRKIPPHWSQYPEKHQKCFPLCWSFTPWLYWGVSKCKQCLHVFIWLKKKGTLHTVKTTFYSKLLLLTYCLRLGHACSYFLEQVTKPGENKSYYLENSSLLCGKSLITVAKITRICFLPQRHPEKKEKKKLI